MVYARKRAKIHDLGPVNFASKNEFLVFHLSSSHDTKYLSQSTLLSSLRANGGNLFPLLGRKVKGTEADRKRKEKFLRSAAEIPREILYSYTRCYLRFNRAYMWRKEFDGSKCPTTLVSVCGRAKRKRDRARPSPVTSFCTSLCSCLRKTFDSTSHSAFRKSSFFPRFVPLWRHLVDCFFHEALPRRWKTCKTWQSPRRIQCSASHRENIRATRRTLPHKRAWYVMWFVKLFITIIPVISIYDAYFLCNFLCKEIRC